MSHRLLRSYATLLVVLGWLHVVLFTLLGFAPWLGLVGQLVRRCPNGALGPVCLSRVGLLVGTLCGLAYFAVSGVIRVLLDQRDFLEEILQAHHRLLRLAESGSRAVPSPAPRIRSISPTSEGRGALL